MPQSLLAPLSHNGRVNLLPKYIRTNFKWGPDKVLEWRAEEVDRVVQVIRDSDVTQLQVCVFETSFVTVAADSPLAASLLQEGYKPEHNVNIYEGLRKMNIRGSTVLVIGR